MLTNRIAVAAMLSALTLAGCTNVPPPETGSAAVAPIRCEDEPSPSPLPLQDWSNPALAMEIQDRRDKAVAEYIAALQLWGRACAAAAGITATKKAPAGELEQ